MKLFCHYFWVTEIYKLKCYISVHYSFVRSEDREKALQLCGWRFDKESTLNSFLDHLEAEGSYARAAAIAVFNLKLRKAIEILNRGAATQNKQSIPTNLNIVAMALSGKHFIYNLNLFVLI